MSPRDWKDRIQDILEALAEIQSFVEDMRFEEFQEDVKTIRAVELELIIIGEAANAIPQDVQLQHSEIAWHLMRGMRNRLVHSYFSISPQILWDTIQKDLPSLGESLQSLLF